MNIINLLFKTSSLTITLAIITGLISGASSTGIIAIINLVLTNPNQNLSQLGTTFTILCIAMLISNISSQLLLARLSEDAIYKMRLNLANQILKTPLRQLEKIGNPKLLATLTDDIISLSRAFLDFPFLCSNLAIVISCLIYLAILSPLVFICLLLLIIITISAFQLIVHQSQNFFTRARNEQDKLYTHFQTLIWGIKELKLNQNRKQAFINQELQTTAQSSRSYNIMGLSLFAIAGSSGILVLFITIGLLLIALPNILPISNWILSGYAFAIIYMTIPMEGILSKLPVFSKANIALAKIQSLQLSLTDHQTKSQPIIPKTTWSKIELINVTHTYEPDGKYKFILGPINLTIHPKEILFIIGGNGSGKSTLVKLISGLYIPESGKILLDNQPIAEHNRESYLQYFSAIFADFHLFQNLLGLDPAKIEHQASKYLDLLELNNKVQIQHSQLSTTQLSQGQKKRLALLTAYLEDRPIYIFDEWAADQDPLFKEIFYHQLLPELKNQGKTIIVITHDDQYFGISDRIIKLNYGQIIYDP